jgi:F-type H+-transporting ATPase subunit delta
MRVHSRAAQRYAAVLFELARDSGELEPVRADAASLRWIAERAPDFRGFLANHRIRKSERERALRELFSERLHPLTFRFILFLEAKKRLGLLEPIMRHFGERWDRHAGIVRGRLATPFAPEADVVEAIREWGRRRVRARLELAVDVDPGLCGGFRLQADSVVYDFSLAGQLRMLRKEMTGEPAEGIRHAS